MRILLQGAIPIFVLLCISYASIAQSIAVTDFSHQELRLAKPAKRIVALAPHIVENLFSAGAGEYIVGAVDYCDYPEQANRIPRVGSISHFSLETILSVNPDLVVAWDSGHGGRVIDRLKALKIPVYASNPKKLEDVAKSIRDFGKLAATTAIAEPSARKYLNRLSQLKAENRAKARLSVLYQVWNSPLQTLNNQHIISDLIMLCGGKNAFGDSPAIAPKISVESVILRNPDVIVASGMGQERPEWLDEWRRWPMLKASKADNLFFIPPDIIQRHTIRILDGAALMCEHLDAARLKSR